jgi:hypothetical protein
MACQKYTVPGNGLYEAKTCRAMEAYEAYIIKFVYDGLDVSTSKLVFETSFDDLKISR